MEMKIHVKESAIIKPANETPKQKLWLSNIDLIQVRLHMGLLHFYKPNNSSDFFEIRILKEALSSVLVVYYPAAGRLRRGENGRLELQCNGEGVLFVEAETDFTLNDIPALTQSLDLARLVPPIDYSGDISSLPLVLIQVTFFKCGGVCVGIGIHHTFGDGASLMSLVDAWSRTARGLPITATPFIDRTILRARDPPSPAFHHTEYQPPPFRNPHNKTSTYKSVPKMDSAVASLKITLAQLNTLKAKARNIGRYSTYEVLVAHIWHCSCQTLENLDLEDDQATRLHIIVDGRSRLLPRLPRGYFGNVLFHTRPVALSVDLKREPYASTVEKIHGEIKKMNDEYLRSAIDYLEKHPNIEDLVPREGNPIFQCSNLCIVDWTKPTIYELDFGWGRPSYVSHANINEGKGFIRLSPDNNGSLLLTMCLKSSHLHKFKKLFYEPLLVAAM